MLALGLGADGVSSSLMYVTGCELSMFSSIPCCASLLECVMTSLPVLLLFGLLYTAADQHMAAHVNPRPIMAIRAPAGSPIIQTTED